MTAENKDTQVRCNLLVIRSRQMEQAACFYETLGLRFSKHRHGDGPEHYAADSGYLTFEIYPLATNATPTTGTRFGFAVKNIEDIFERLIQAGGKSVSSPKQSPWGLRAVLSDLDGHKVELTSMD